MIMQINSRHDVIKVRNRNREILYGIMTAPIYKDTNKKSIIIFCQAGLVTKTGVGNHFKIMSDYLAENGYHVLCFDQSGTGDSQGFLSNDIPINHFFSLVIDGAYKNDTLDLIKWVSVTYPDFKLFLMGQCGGCLSMFYAGSEKISHISGFIALTVPVLLLRKDDDKNLSVREFDARVALYLYLKKLISIKSIINFIKGKSDIELIKGSFITYVRSLKRRLSAYVLNQANMMPDHSRFNWRFWDAFQIIIKNRKPILFVMASLDNETFEFDTEFKAKVLDTEPSYSELVTLRYIPNSDHSIMFKEARGLLNEQVQHWLDNTVNN